MCVCVCECVCVVCVCVFVCVCVCVCSMYCLNVCVCVCVLASCLLSQTSRVTLHHLFSSDTLSLISLVVNIPDALFLLPSPPQTAAPKSGPKQSFGRGAPEEKLRSSLCSRATSTLPMDQAYSNTLLIYFCYDVLFFLHFIAMTLGNQTYRYSSLLSPSPYPYLCLCLSFYPCV